jgi:hypothetical protein
MNALLGLAVGTIGYLLFNRLLRVPTEGRRFARLLQVVAALLFGLALAVTVTLRDGRPATILGFAVGGTVAQLVINQEALRRWLQRHR